MFQKGSINTIIGTGGAKQQTAKQQTLHMAIFYKI